MKDKPLSADGKRNDAASTVLNTPKESSSVPNSQRWRKVEHASKDKSKYRVIGSFTKQAASEKFFYKPVPPTLYQSP